MKKGSLVLVSGRLSVDTYTDKHNQTKTSVEVVALDVRFLDKKVKEDTEVQQSTDETIDDKLAA